MLNPTEYKILRELGLDYKFNPSYGYYIYYDVNEVMVYNGRDLKNSIFKSIKSKYMTDLNNGKKGWGVTFDESKNVYYEILEIFTEERNYGKYSVRFYHAILSFDVYGKEY